MHIVPPTTASERRQSLPTSPTQLQFHFTPLLDTAAAPRVPTSTGSPGRIIPEQSLSDPREQTDRSEEPRLLRMYPKCLSYLDRYNVLCVCIQLGGVQAHVQWITLPQMPCPRCMQLHTCKNPSGTLGFCAFHYRVESGVVTLGRYVSQRWESREIHWCFHLCIPKPLRSAVAEKTVQSVTEKGGKENPIQRCVLGTYSTIAH